MDMSSWLLPVCIGLLAGASSGLFGIGGGVVIVPLIVYFYQVPQQTATATSLIALLLPVGSLGVWEFYQRGFIHSTNLKIGLMIAAGMFLGTFGGARLSASFSSATMTRAFAVFLVLVAFRLWFTASGR